MVETMCQRTHLKIKKKLRKLKQLLFVSYPLLFFKWITHQAICLNFHFSIKITSQQQNQHPYHHDLTD